MNDPHQPDEADKPKSPSSHTLLWSLVGIFIVVAIGLMWAADAYFSPEMISPSTLPEAVGK